MKKFTPFILVLLTLTIVPLAFAQEKSAAKNALDFAVIYQTESSETLSTETSTDQLIPALNAQDSIQLTDNLLGEDVRFGSYYGAWWGGWETDMSVDAMLEQIWRIDTLGQLSAEILPNEPTWFLQNLNPYTDLLPNEAVETVLLINNFSENSDAELLAWISADGKVSTLVLSSTGFQRVAR